MHGIKIAPQNYVWADRSELRGVLFCACYMPR